MLKQRIDQDLKQALLDGDKFKVTTLRSLKSAILYAEVAQGSRDQGLSEEDTISVIAKEVKKRQDSITLYRKAKADDRADAEEAENKIIEVYLPQQLTDDELISVIEAQIAQLESVTPAAMGTVIAVVKQETAGRADGGRIAKLVKERLL